MSELKLKTYGQYRIEATDILLYCPYVRFFSFSDIVLFQWQREGMNC